MPAHDDGCGFEVSKEYHFWFHLWGQISQNAENKLSTSRAQVCNYILCICLTYFTEETIVIPEINIVHNSVDGVTVTPELENFPDVFNVKLYYTVEKQPQQGPFDGSENSHPIPLQNKQEPSRVTANATDPYGYKAQCSFAILEGKQAIPRFYNGILLTRHPWAP